MPAKPRDARQYWREIQQTAIDHGFRVVEVIQQKRDIRGAYPVTAYVLYRTTTDPWRRIGRRGTLAGLDAMLRRAMRTDPETRSQPR